MHRSLKVFVALFLGVLSLSLALASVSLARPAPPSQLTPPADTPAARPLAVSSGAYTMYDTLTPADVPTATYQWVDISQNYDFRWDMGDETNDVSDGYSIGFGFPFYENFYTSFRISEKGYIFFDDPDVFVGSGEGLPNQIPNSNTEFGINNFIAPFAANLIGYPGISEVLIRTDTSPQRTIIQFNNVVWCCGQYNPRTFQIILYPTGIIDIQYRKITNFPGSLDDNKIVRVGLENREGTAGDVYTQGAFLPDASGYWQDNMALRFIPDLDVTTAAFVPASRTVWDDPGRAIFTAAPLYLISTSNPPVTRSFSLSHSMTVSSSLPVADWEAEISYPASLPAFTSGLSITPTFVVTVPSTVVNFDDVATLTITALSTDFVPFSATYQLVYGPAQRDLVLEKSISPKAPPAENGAFRYRFVVRNTDANDSGRSGTARDVIITDVLASNLGLEGCDNCNYVTSTLGSQTAITISLGDMYPNETRTVRVEARNLNPAETPGGTTGTGSLLEPTLIPNTAYLTTTDSLEIGPLDNNVDSVSFTVAVEPTSDLRMDKYYRFDPDSVAAGQAVPFGVWFYNQGNTPLTNVTLIDTLPAGTTFNRAELRTDGPENTPVGPITEGPITPTISGPMSRTLTFNLPVVDNGGWNRTYINIWVNVPQTTSIGAVLENVAVISDGISSDSDARDIIITSQHVDPTVTKSPSLDEAGNVIPPEPGKDYTYWIRYENRNTTEPATNLIITDTLPASVTLIGATAGQYMTGPIVTQQPGGTVILPPLNGGGTSAFPGGYLDLVWYNISNIPPGGSGEIAVVVRVDENVAPGSLILNNIALTYTGQFSPATDLDDSGVVTVETNSQIYGSYKTANVTDPTAGEILRFTVGISNASLTQTISFTAFDPIPASLEYLDHLAPSHGVVTVTGSDLLWTADNLGPDSTATLVFRARVPESAMLDQNIRNTAYITSNGVSIMRHADLTVSGGLFGNSAKLVEPETARSGEIVTYTLVASNTGSASSVVTLTDSLPPEVTLVPGSFTPPASGVSVSADNRSLTWTTEVSAQNENRLSFQVEVAQALADEQTIINTAQLETDSGDLLALPNTLTLSNPDFSTSSKTAADPEVTANGDIFYTILAANQGSASGAFTVTDSLPVSTSLVAGSFAPASALVTVTGNSFVWTGFAEAGQTISLTFRAVAEANVQSGQTLTNTASLNDDIGSPALPLEAIVTVNNGLASDFTASTKTVAFAGDSLTSGQSVTYTLVASNSGSTGAVATLTDDVPPEMSLDEASFSGPGTVEVAGNSFTWTIFVAADDSASLSFNATVNAGLGDGVSIENVAQLDTNALPTALPLTASTTISNALWTGSSKTANTSQASPGEVVTYSLTALNSGSVTGTATLTDIFPAELDYVVGSVSPVTDVTVLADSLIWQPTLGPGESLTLTFAMSVPLGLLDGTPVTNTAQLNHQSLLAPLTFSHTLTVASASVNGSKTVSPANTRLGEAVTFTLTANNGGSLTTTATLTDSLPAELRLLSDTLSLTDGVTLAGNGFVWQPTLGPGDSLTLTFQSVVTNLLDGQSVVNLAELDDASLSAVIPLTASVTVREASLSGSTKRVSPSIANPGDTVTYTLVISNVGTGGANVLIGDSLPDGLTLDPASFNPASANVTLTDKGFVWDVTISNQTSRSLSYQATLADGLADGAVLTNTATITNEDSGSVIMRQSVVTVRGPVFSSLSKTASPGTVNVGEVVTFSLTASNSGQADGVAQVSDTLPDGLTLDPASFAPASAVVSVDGNSFIWTAEVSATSEASLSFQATTASDLLDGTVLTNTASLSHSNLSAVLTASATVNVAAPVISGVGKTASADTAQPGERITYTLSVANSGSAEGTATVSDSLPAGLNLVTASFVPSDALISLNGNSFTWTATVAGQGEASLSFGADVANGLSDGTVLTNSAEVVDDLSGVSSVISHSLTVQTALLAGSSKTAALEFASSAGVMTYTLSVSNSGSAAAQVSLTDVLPTELTLIPASLNPSLPGLDINGNSFTWTTSVPGNSQASLSYSANIAADLADGLRITNTATLSEASLSEALLLTASFVISNTETGTDIYLPIVLK